MTEAPFTHIVIRRLSSGADTFIEVGTLVKSSEIPVDNLSALVGADYLMELTPDDYEKYNAPTVVETVTSESDTTEPEVVAEVAPKPATKKPATSKSPAKKSAAKPVKKPTTK